ncbi:MAG TPA: endo-1,4-beta-xylanase [Dictyoglomaceae bacterium]|nr:endo-1,4-beta-xylanase [Dictyoglomaceae bacterium]HOL39330.1 endo-1,4-beta-xylanase [Dictyoglomaceae bacterium]HPP15988.1 endo-1,4-beta-xylanase [Dictyoglomaceae bacterium]
MKKHVILSILLILLFVMSLGFGSADLYITYSFENGSLDEASGTSERVKLSSVSDVAYDGKYALKVGNRVSSWDGCSIDLTYNVESGIDYEISCFVYQNSGRPQPFQLIAHIEDLAGERFEIIGETVVVPKVWKEIKGKLNFTYSGFLEKLNIMIVSPNEAGFDFYVDKVQVLGANRIEIPGTIVSSTFESGSTENWQGRGDDVKVIPSKDVAHIGEYSLFVTGRTKGWHGAQLDVSKILEPGKSYDISVWVYQKTGETQKVTLTMQRKYNTDAQTKYDTIIWQKNVPDNTWIEFSGGYSVPSNVQVEELILYLESPNTTLEFYVDDAKVIDKTVTKAQPELEIPSLADIFKGDFRIGVAIPYRVLANPMESKMVLKHFNSITPENEMKPDALQPREGEFDFSRADAYVKFAEENGIAVRGHTLVWHQQTPDWFFVDKDGKPVSKEVLLKRLENHIKTVVGRYKGKIYAWDVVNEAIDPSQPDGYRRSKWYEIIGPEYIEKAFIWAHEADPNAKLFYNDYNTEDVKTRELIYNLVKGLKEKGVPIHGIGIQGHINITWPEVEEMERTIQLFSSIPGIEIHITELDMSVYSGSGDEYPILPRDVAIKQAYRYKKVFDMLKKYNKVVTNVTFWGLKDDYSWLTVGRGRANYPLLFDKDYQAKFAYWALVSPNVLPPLTQQAKMASGQAIIDGLEDKSYKSAVPIVVNDGEKDIAVIKPIWYMSKVFIYAEVYDKTKEDKDNVSIFIDQNNAKSPYLQMDDLYFKIFRNGNVEASFAPALNNYVVKETDNGYVVECEIQIYSVAIGKGSKLGFDFSVADGDKVVSWSDTSNQQTLNTVRYGTIELEEAVKLAQAKKGTPVIDAVMDELYKQVEPIETETVVSGSLKGAKGKAWMLWDEDHIYVYAEIMDPDLDDASANPWEHDSFEVFIDENNAKSMSYQPDDAQYRVNFKNLQSFGTGASKEFIQSAARILKDGDKVIGFAVEIGIKMKTRKLSPGVVIGFDIQVNNGSKGTRTDILTWNDPIGDNWRDTRRFGNLELVQ